MGSDCEKGTASAKALAVLGILRAAGAVCQGRALTDAEIAKRAHVSRREVIDLARELAETAGVAVLASCGERNGGRRSKGRYIEGDSMKVRTYGERLHKRAKQIHGRAKVFKNLADRMDSQRQPDSRGQMRLFA